MEFTLRAHHLTGLLLYFDIRDGKTTFKEYDEYSKKVGGQGTGYSIESYKEFEKVYKKIYEDHKKDPKNVKIKVVTGGVDDICRVCRDKKDTCSSQDFDESMLKDFHLKNNKTYSIKEILKSVNKYFDKQKKQGYSRPSYYKK